MDTSSPRSPSPSDPLHVHSFPNEILERILLQVVRSSPDTREVLPILALVCKRWADIVGLQVFQSHFVLDFKGNTSHEAGSGTEHLSKLFKVSDRFFNRQPHNPIPRSIVLKTAYNNDLYGLHCYSDPEIFMGICGADGQLDQRTASKIREADFCVDPVVALSFFISFNTQLLPNPHHTTWTQLTTLKLVSTWGSRMPDELLEVVIQGGQLITSMPQLTNLQLTAHDIIPWEKCFPWSQLKVLDLRIEIEYIEDLLRVFHQCRGNLEEFHLQACTTLRDRSFITPGRVRFRALKRFELVVEVDEDELENAASVLEYFFKSVEFPEVRSASVRSLERTVFVNELVFSPFILDCGKLTELSLYYIAFNRPPPFNESMYSEKVRDEAFNSFFGNLPRSLESLLLVAYVESGFYPLEVFWIHEILRKERDVMHMLPLGLRDMKVLLSGPAAVQCQRFVNEDVPAQESITDRLSVGIMENDAAFEEFYEDFPVEEDEEYDMEIDG